MMTKSKWATSPSFLVRYWNAGATSPCAISGAAAPRVSSMSSVGGWKVEARDSILRSLPASNTVTGTPLRRRLAAAVSPTGPAPAIKTRSSDVMTKRVADQSGFGQGEQSSKFGLLPLPNGEREQTVLASRSWSTNVSLDLRDARLADDVAVEVDLAGVEFLGFVERQRDRRGTGLGEGLLDRRVG